MQVFNYMPSMNEGVENWPTTQRYTLGEGYVGVVLVNGTDIWTEYGAMACIRFNFESLPD